VLPSKYDAAISYIILHISTTAAASKQASNIKFVCAKRAAREQMQDPIFSVQRQVQMQHSNSGEEGLQLQTACTYTCSSQQFNLLLRYNS